MAEVSEKRTGAPTILVAGGGSAGHVSPMLATARALVTRYPQVRVVALGTADGLEATLVPEAGFELLTIDKVPFPRRPSLAALKFPFAFAAQLRSVRGLLRDHNVVAIAGFGGYVCPPAYIAGALARIPIALHEANKRPGLANILGAKVAKVVATAFEPTSEGRSLPGAVRVGMPMRPGIAHLDRAAARNRARDRFGLDPDLPTLLVTGGSLGAVRLNDTVVAALPALEKMGVQVLHVTGRGKQIDAAGRYYRQVEYVDAMEDAYAAADFAVTRSGAGTVCELAAVGLPALFVPLPVGNGEQALNGKDVVAAGGARMIDDSALTPDEFVAVVRECLVDAQTRSAMAVAAARFGVTDAAERLADMIAGLIPGIGTAANAKPSTEGSKK